MSICCISLPTHADASVLGAYPTEVGKIVLSDSKEESPLYGRSVLFFGDSLCNARGEREAGLIYAGYAGRIGVRYDMSFENYGVSGIALSTAKGSTTVSTIVQRAYGNNNMREEPLSYDLVVLQGGVNDAWVNAPLGEVSDSFQYRDFDRSTFAGGLEATICRAKEYFPDATVCYLIMYKMPLAQWAENGGNMVPVEGVRNMDAYVDLQRQILEKWEIPYLDFYGDESFNRDVFKVETTTYLSGDYVHMTADGYNIIFKYIAAWLETLPLSERMLPESETETEIESKPETEAVSDVEEERETAILEATEAETEAPVAKEKGKAPGIFALAAVGGVVLAGLASVLIWIRKRR